MRKVTEESIACFLAGIKYNSSNTNVVISDETTKLQLFGHVIAEKTKDGKVFISNAGYATNTTKERLNGLPNVSISQKKGVWYLNGKEWDGKRIKVG